MTKVLQNRLSDIREACIKNKHKDTVIRLSICEISELITGLKVLNAFDYVLDDEIQIKHNRATKNKLNCKS